MSVKTKAKFLGNEDDPMTRVMGIRHGKKYQMEVKPAGFFAQVFRDIKLLVKVKEGGRFWVIPYSNECTFKANWRLLR